MERLGFIYIIKPISHKPECDYLGIDLTSIAHQCSKRRVSDASIINGVVIEDKSNLQLPMR